MPKGKNKSTLAKIANWLSSAISPWSLWQLRPLAFAVLPQVNAHINIFNTFSTLYYYLMLNENPERT